MTRLYPPHEAAAKIEIADSTLRLWSPKYEKFLSEHAHRGRRTFTERDILVLQEVKKMADDNMPHSKIITALSAIKFPDETDETPESPVTEETPNSATAAQGATMALVQVMATTHSAQLADTAQRLTQQDAVIHELRRDLEAVQRSLDHALARLEALEGKVSSVGDSMHRHSGPVNLWTRKE